MQELNEVTSKMEIREKLWGLHREQVYVEAENL